MKRTIKSVTFNGELLFIMNTYTDGWVNLSDNQDDHIILYATKTRLLNTSKVRFCSRSFRFMESSGAYDAPVFVFDVLAGLIILTYLPLIPNIDPVEDASNLIEMVIFIVASHPIRFAWLKCKLSEPTNKAVVNGYGR